MRRVAGHRRLTATPGDEGTALSLSCAAGGLEAGADGLYRLLPTPIRLVTRRHGRPDELHGKRAYQRHTNTHSTCRPSRRKHLEHTWALRANRRPRGSSLNLAARQTRLRPAFTWSNTRNDGAFSYTLSYYNEDAASDVTEQPIDKGATSITLDNPPLNDKNYYFRWWPTMQEPLSGLHQGHADPE